mmetsp:Transcript_6687/g.11249  ORF Transcript_6687/g.11249 Transcript_6687/m.11249 type:complete len:133 (+) Transcript_6687:1080-1478(+)
MIRWDVPRVIEAATSCNESSNIITISAASYVESMCVDVCLEGRIVGRVVKGKFVRGAWWMGRQNSKQFELLMSDLGKQDLVAVEIGSIDTNDRIVFFMHISCCVAAMYISRVSVGVVASCSCCVKLQARNCA